MNRSGVFDILSTVHPATKKVYLRGGGSKAIGFACELEPRIEESHMIDGDDGGDRLYDIACEYANENWPDHCECQHYPSAPDDWDEEENGEWDPEPEAIDDLEDCRCGSYGSARDSYCEEHRDAEPETDVVEYEIPRPLLLWGDSYPLQESPFRFLQFGHQGEIRALGSPNLYHDGTACHGDNPTPTNMFEAWHTYWSALHNHDLPPGPFALSDEQYLRPLYERECDTDPAGDAKRRADWLEDRLCQVPPEYHQYLRTVLLPPGTRAAADSEDPLWSALYHGYSPIDADDHWPDWQGSSRGRAVLMGLPEAVAGQYLNAFNNMVTQHRHSQDLHFDRLLEEERRTSRAHTRVENARAHIAPRAMAHRANRVGQEDYGNYLYNRQWDLRSRRLNRGCPFHLAYSAMRRLIGNNLHDGSKLSPDLLDTRVLSRRMDLAFAISSESQRKMANYFDRVQWHHPLQIHPPKFLKRIADICGKAVTDVTIRDVLHTFFRRKGVFLTREMLALKPGWSLDDWFDLYFHHKRRKQECRHIWDTARRFSEQMPGGLHEFAANLPPGIRHQYFGRGIVEHKHTLTVRDPTAIVEDPPPFLAVLGVRTEYTGSDADELTVEEGVAGHLTQGLLAGLIPLLGEDLTHIVEQTKDEIIPFFTERKPYKDFATMLVGAQVGPLSWQFSIGDRLFRATQIVLPGERWPDSIPRDIRNYSSQALCWGEVYANPND